MRSLASMTGTGDLSGGDTLAGGGAAEGGNRMLGLLLSATAGAPRALPARRDSVSGDIRLEMPRTVHIPCSACAQGSAESAE